MKLVGNFEFLGVQVIQGRKDVTKTYYNVLLMQDADIVKIFVNDEVIRLFDGVKKMDKVKCMLDINIGRQKTYINVLQVEKINKVA